MTTPEPTLRELYVTAAACDAAARAHGFEVYPLAVPADVAERGLPHRLYTHSTSAALLFWVVGYPSRRQLDFGDTATVAGTAWAAGDTSALEELLSLHDAERLELRAGLLREEAARRFYRWRWRLARARRDAVTPREVATISRHESMNPSSRRIDTGERNG